MRILVIGGTGLVGRAVARQLLQDGYHVRVPVRDRESACSRLGTGFDYVPGDVEDEASLERPLQSCDGVHVGLGARNRGDVGRMDAANRDLFVHGPEPITIAQALHLYCSFVEPDKRVVTVPLALMRLVDRLFIGGKLRANLELMGLLQRVGERGDPTEANRVLGAPRTTVRDWCEQQAASTAAR